MILSCAVYFPLVWSEDFDQWRLIEKWVNNNIEKGNYNFQELNIGNYGAETFDKDIHNCVKIAFKNKTDKNYFILM